ncbi:glycosyl hydrolase family 18 protein [Geothrix sp. PMB-07]|uniref:glycosyl hydrolase family 18 protein n=1 Tax=Geothrix sp. PMB-07 TaxID=3068640 RepID=UPI002741D505|nr:glycosyl hydrolase family 18 protein [Geothrix sp. PMB-07]WLT33282.1 glycosyl hydrolase family 18 protein [Geothrix sp. PMB-07]
MKRLLLLASLTGSLVAHDVIGWIPPYQLGASRKALAHRAGAVTADQWLSRMGLQFWILTPEGKLAYAERGETITDAEVAHFRNWGKAKGVPVLLTVYNHDGKIWDWQRARSAFALHRDALVTSLVDEMTRHGLDGIDLDLEGEGYLDADREAYGAFVKALSTAVHAKGKLLTVDSFHSPCFNAPNMAWWGDWQGQVDGIHSMGYGDLYEANAASFTPEGGKPCAEGAAIFRFSWQIEWAKGKGFRPAQVLLGIPGWQYEWGGAALPKHLEDLAKVGAGCAVWDIPSTLGSDKDPRWGSETAWAALARFKRQK